jgi:hypothetical protein
MRKGVKIKMLGTSPDQFEVNMTLAWKEKAYQYLL